MSSNPANANSATLSTFVTALVTNLIVLTAELAVFTILRPKFKVIYSPRTYIPIEGRRSDPMDQSIWRWPMEVFKLDYDDIRRQNGLDAYVYVRYLRMMIKILLPVWLLTWVVLLPVNAVRKPEGYKGLDRFTFGNIQDSDYARKSAHLIIAYIVTVWICYTIKGELRHYITVRQRHLVDPRHANSAQASTILITGVPPRMLEPAVLRRTFDILPGGVRKIWVNRDLKDIPDLVDERTDALNMLESAEVTLMGLAAKHELKKKKALAKGKTLKEKELGNEVSRDDPEAPLTLAHRLVPKKDRPTHKLKSISWLPFALPFTGKKVDTIDWCLEEIPRLNKEIRTRQETYESEQARDTVTADESETYPRQNSAFVQFNRQIAAHLAAQSLNHHEPYRMATRYTNVAPDDIIWSNLNLNPYESKIRMAISYAATAGLIILWAFPVAFVGIISNIKALAAKYTWLHWLNSLPGVVIGIISGVLPPVGLAVLMILLPIVLRLLAQFEGIPRYTGLELSLMTRFFIFQVIHSFLIVTLTSGIIAALAPLLQNPSSAANLLAERLPAASTFFLTYILLQLSAIAGGFLQIVPLLIYYVKLFLLGSTPRSVYNIKNTMRSVQWGTLFPSTTLLVVITIAYSVISPIICGLACAIFFLMFQMYKYLFLYQFDQPPASDTGGLFFPKAITHLFVGVYISQICLCALFFLSRNDGMSSAIPEGALMVVLIVFTAGYHSILNDSYGPLKNSLPLSLADKSIVDGDSASVSDNGADIEKSNGSKARSTAFDQSNEKAYQRNKAPGGHASRSDDMEMEDRSPQSDSRVDLGHYGADEEGNFKARNSTGFTHPALGQPRVVWIPQDELGLYKDEEEAIAAQGIDVSSKHAVMSEDGTVDVSSYPPGEPPKKPY